MVRRSPVLLTFVLVVAALQLGAAGGAIAARSDTQLPRVVFVARNDVPFDSLAAGPVAALFGAPIVITSPAPPLNPAAATILGDLEPDLVIIAGGEAAISPEVEAEVEAACGCPAERASGAGRDDTAAEVARLLEQYGIGRPVVTGTAVDPGAGVIPNLDADLLDGLDADEFASADHDHRTVERRWASCPVSAFQPVYDAAYDNQLLQDGFEEIDHGRNSSADLVCPLSLPDGAVIDLIKVGAYDGNDTSGVVCDARRLPIATAQVGPPLSFGSGETGAIASPGRTAFELELDEHPTVANSLYAYDLYCDTFGTTGWVHSATVGYSLVDVGTATPES